MSSDESMKPAKGKILKLEPETPDEETCRLQVRLETVEIGEDGVYRAEGEFWFQAPQSEAEGFEDVRANGAMVDMEVQYDDHSVRTSNGESIYSFLMAQMSLPKFPDASWEIMV